jgi:hypothetical protein
MGILPISFESQHGQDARDTKQETHNARREGGCVSVGATIDPKNLAD